MSRLVPLARVHFRENVALPGVSQPGKDFQYPEHEAILYSVDVPAAPTVRQKTRFRLHLDLSCGQVLVTHPKSGETERYPMGLVQQMRYLDAATPAPEGK